MTTESLALVVYQGLDQGQKTHHRRPPRCGYCQGIGHNILGCTHEDARAVSERIQTAWRYSVAYQPSPFFLTWSLRQVPTLGLRYIAVTKCGCSMASIRNKSDAQLRELLLQRINDGDCINVNIERLKTRFRREFENTLEGRAKLLAIDTLLIHNVFSRMSDPVVGPTTFDPSCPREERLYLAWYRSVYGSFDDDEDEEDPVVAALVDVIVPPRTRTYDIQVIKTTPWLQAGVSDSSLQQDDDEGDDEDKGEDDVCPICFDNCTSENLVQLSCTHSTCIDCFSGYFKSLNMGVKHPSCSLCRAPISQISLQDNPDTRSFCREFIR
jgi:Zinc finger, C3HC4 type (RING finger)